MFSNGRRVHTPYFTLIVLPQQRDRQHTMRGRVAFVAGKKLGNAVWRNAAKRRMRAIAFDSGAGWSGYDVVFLAKKRVTSSVYEDMLSACGKALQQAGIHQVGE